MFRVSPHRAVVFAVLAVGTTCSVRSSHSQTATQRSTLIGWAHDNWVSVVGAYVPRRGWRHDAQAKGLFPRGTVMRVYSVLGPVGSTTLGTVETAEPMGWGATGSRRFTSSQSLLALSARHNVAPRSPRLQALDNPLYERIVAQELRRLGIRVARVRLSQHLRVDLNGDGSEEVLLTAQSRPDMGAVPRARRNDYAIAVLRYVVGSQARTAVLASQVYPRAQAFTASQLYRIAGCYDIDGDRTLEVVLGSGYYEGEGVEIYKFDGRFPRRVLDAGWGA